LEFWLQFVKREFYNKVAERISFSEKKKPHGLKYPVVFIMICSLYLKLFDVMNI